MNQLTPRPFEVGRRGKPDEWEGNCAELVLAFFMENSPTVRLDPRIYGSFNGSPHVTIGGEVSAEALAGVDLHDLTDLVNNYYNAIHKHHPSSVQVNFDFTPQGSVLDLNSFDDRKSGDSGNPVAVAYGGSPYNLPWENVLAVGIRDLFDSIYAGGGVVPSDVAAASGVYCLEGLKADGKINVFAMYDGASLHSIRKITAAIQHEKSLPVSEIRASARAIIDGYLRIQQEKYTIAWQAPNIVINNGGSFIEGGWKVDQGNREAKPYRQLGFGQYMCNEDSPNGEDPSKPSGTGTYLARNIAVNLVAGGIDFAQVLIDVDIGDVQPDVIINTLPSNLDQQVLAGWVKENFDLSLAAAIERYDLRNPELRRVMARASDGFYGPFPWNEVTKPYEA